MDLAQLTKRSKGTQWNFKALEDWIDGDWSMGPRAMCVLAGAGTGKSTISAAVWNKVRFILLDTHAAGVVWAQVSKPKGRSLF